jgi:dTDP-4-amino-4,6-dideoxygalactose transaminase
MKTRIAKPTIPFTRVYRTGRELEYVKKCIKGGSIVGDAEYTRRCESLMEKLFGAGKVILTNSCTDALEMAALLLDLAPGDEVILPSFTFVSTANAVVLRGAVPVFVDIREDTLNIDETRIEELITERTKAIFPVHYSGVGCEMDTILDLARKHGLYVVEDAAQGVNATYKGRFLGTLGDLGTYSFHATKNYTCGEGGALIVNNESFAKRAEILREKGTNRKELLHGLVDKYTWVDVGSSYLLSDILAAFLLAQLEAADSIKERRKTLYTAYMAALKELEDAGKLSLPVIPPYCETNYHLFFVLLPSETERNQVIAKLKEEGIQATFHYIPLHSSPMGTRLAGRARDLPVTESVSRRLLRLPLYPDLTHREQIRVVDSLKKCL